MPARPTRVKTFVLAVGGSVLLSIAASGCGTSPPAQGSPPPVQSSTPRGPGGHDGLTDQEYAAAVALAREEVRKDDAHVTSATATVGPGVVTDSNLGYRCTSGKVLQIKLIGRFPHIVVSGLDTRGSTVPAGAFTVHAVLLTVDAESGRACREGVQTGEVAPEPGATVLALD